MCTGEQYDQLHLFLDESGPIRELQDVNLVGGVVVLGPYDDAADQALQQLLASAVTEFQGQFPGDLHFFQSNIGRPQMKRLCQTLGLRLLDWQGSQRRLFAVAIRHQQDVFTHGPEILAEREQDNRYLLMLCQLVEYLCYVDPAIQALLSPDAQVHLYVAQRYFCVDRSTVNRELLQALGYEVREVHDRRPHYLVKSVTERELRGLIVATLKEHWPQSRLAFKTFRVVRVEYQKRADVTKPAALYLADLALGSLRLRCYRDPWPLLAPALPILNYGPQLHHLIQMQSELKRGNLVRFLEQAREFWCLKKASRQAVAPNGPVQKVLAEQQRVAARLVGQHAEPLVRFLREVCAIVDRPGAASSGIRLADFAIEILRQAGQVSIEAEVLALQAQLSGANHLGEREIADACWDSYSQREAQLMPLGLRGLELMVEMRNRRAVSRIDQFCFEEAKIVLADILTKVEKGLEPLAQMFGLAAADVPSRLLGALYGTLGQAFALQSKPDHHRAEECFRKAMSLFAEPEDRERQWVYLGHLACDQGQVAHHLWQEVCEHLPGLASLSPMVEPGKQYQLALQIKGIFVFRPLEDVVTFLSEWGKVDLSQVYSDEDLALHPFGLIYQGIAMLYMRYWRETQQPTHAQQALEWLDRASHHLEAGGPVLKVLGQVAKVRRWLLESELPGRAPRAASRLGQLLQGLRGYLAEHFGECAWGEGPEGKPIGHFGQFDPGPNYPWRDRASALLHAVRFNYW